MTAPRREYEPGGPASAKTERARRLAGCLRAAAVGDALGWPNEPGNQRRSAGRTRERHSSGFEQWTRRSGGRFWAIEEPIDAGSYSDDTQLLLATTRSLAWGSRGWTDWFTKSELPLWLAYERGGGRATRAAADSWSRKIEPWKDPRQSERDRYFNAGGNGAAMRVMPHAFVSHSMSDLRNDTIVNSIATHGHPRAILGAVIYAIAIKLAWTKTGTWELGELVQLLNDQQDTWSVSPEHDDVYQMDGWMDAAVYHPSSDKNYFSLWDDVVAELAAGLRLIAQAIDAGIVASDTTVLTDLNANNRKTNGAGTVSALAAIFLASRYAADPATGVRVAAYEPGVDTDTIASMTGGLLAAMLGSEWIRPEWRDVQDSEMFEEVAREVFRERIPNEVLLSSWTSGSAWDDIQTKMIKEQLESRPADSVKIGPLGTCWVEDQRELKAMSGIRAVQSRIRSVAGQTIFITNRHRAPQTERQRGVPKQIELPVELGESAKQRDVDLRNGARANIQQELKTLKSQLPESMSATEFIEVVDDILSSFDLWFQHHNELSQSERITAAVGSVLKTRGIGVRDEMILPLARVAWRLRGHR